MACRSASIAIGVLALGILAAAPAFASGHEVYPPGWNTPRDPGPVIYTYDPRRSLDAPCAGSAGAEAGLWPGDLPVHVQSLRMHRVP